MKNESLKERIIKYFIGTDKWINGGEIERLAEGAGYKASNASRRLRELHNEQLLERKLDRPPRGKVASVWYRYNA